MRARLGSPTREQCRHLCLEEFEEGERFGESLPGGCRGAEGVDAGARARDPAVEQRFAAGDQLVPAVVLECVVVAARAGLALAAERADLAQVANGALDRGTADPQLLHQLVGGQPAGVARQQGDEHQGRHPRHAGVDERGSEALHELPTAQALRSERGTLIAWVGAVAAFAFILGAVSKSIPSADVSERVQRELADLGSGSIVTPTGYLAFIFLFVIVAVSVFACTQIAAARQEEAGQQLETLLAQPVGRARWLGGRLLLATLGAIVISLTAGRFAWAGAPSAGASISLPELLEAGANALPVALLFLGDRGPGLCDPAPRERRNRLRARRHHVHVAARRLPRGRAELGPRPHAFHPRRTRARATVSRRRGGDHGRQRPGRRGRRDPPLRTPRPPRRLAMRRDHPIRTTTWTPDTVKLVGVDACHRSPPERTLHVRQTGLSIRRRL